MKKNILLLLSLLQAEGTHAGNLLSTLEQQTVSQENKERNIQNKLQPGAPTVFTQQSDTRQEALFYPQENPCLMIRKVQIESGEMRPIPAIRQLAKSAEHQCLGATGISNLQKAIQNQLIGEGLITSRAAVTAYHAKEETLTLSLIYGRVNSIKLSDDSSGHFNLASVFPLKAGDILNIRNVEQGLENINTLPGTLSDIRIAPSQTPGESKIEVLRKQEKYWQLASWVDNSGTKATGRNQGGVALFLNNLTSLNDTLYASHSQNIEISDTRGNSSHAISYSLPYGFWSVDLFAGKSQYHQSIPGYAVDYQYKGQSESLSLQIGRTVSRGARYKTTLNAQLLERDYHYFINDTEIDLQRKRLTNIKIGAKHLHYIDDARVSLSLDILKNMRWFQTNHLDGAYNLSSHIIKAEASVFNPFMLSNLSMDYRGGLTLQLTNYDLPIQDKLGIGSRNTVRGFDGELNLFGNKGIYWQNTMAWNLSSVPLQPYVGSDYGYVMQSENAVGHKLAGGIAGVRIEKWNTSLDTFVGTPLYKPHGFATSSMNIGFSLIWRY
ncbi:MULTISPECIES: ShlB/FhaC/HecB family hemolysin secretion/activation protein [Serratia]|uniref:ShlB/FhaC/HecB family hemolysin secretion/activation protein n=1 Tax=Serratia TaxID=613 RepID=UPI00217AD60C|nr:MULTISPECIES: ShlB/FhaC/HecB family hemolysin secretion/activation protein [Serratia]CAI1108091.1 Hemolysin transporter protein shlB precursor [Serratia quinivorans]CAI1788796.1 Hemolysin transporter protein shlB precursor [Serratia proteamaculans]CAI1869945.1 Hemolysin transporter protein shlB precursor [Serratia quinivorans]CAI1877017.1 Hemolysin transporter protein shlB precursor [Serratia quinivorans]CAI1977457.1 Hemolysin transporter protein shlB precursor [Serratia quinivorans]